MRGEMRKKKIGNNIIEEINKEEEKVMGMKDSFE